MNRPAKRTKAEFGDFQTPIWFSRQICSLLSEQGFRPISILEPTCGQGSFLLSALDCFTLATIVIGADINPNYIKFLQQQVAARKDANKVEVFQADFFETNWSRVLNKLPDPLLIIGNPPWVTNSELASLGSNNLPQKNNFQNHLGIDAITGASNFDISEWMLLKIIEWIDQRQAVVAMLCKTAVARKVLLQIWQQSSTPGRANIYLIDAQKVFNASVDACLLVYDTRTRNSSNSCKVFSNLSPDSFLTQIGYHGGQLIANVEFYKRWKHLESKNGIHYQWRSGIKHDCAKVMELKKIEGVYINKLGETYDLESTYIYPMMKSSEVANSTTQSSSRWMLVTQRSVGDSTLPIKLNAPKTWMYLNDHSEFLDSRKSSIYKNRPRFSIFGVGDYSFASWKVAVSGLYKKLNFVVVGPHEEKPTMLDDTCYFIPCQSEEEARFIVSLLNSEQAQQFFQSFIFWDMKRPITAKVLRRLDLFALAEEVGQRERLENLSRPANYDDIQPKQLKLLEKQSAYDNMTLTNEEQE